MAAAKQADRRTAFLLIAPAMLVLLAVNVYPFLYALYISAQTYTLGRPTPPRYIGLFNYSDLLEDDRFLNALLVSFKFVTLTVSIEFLLGIGLAFLFSARLRGLATLRKLAILPIMVMPLASGLIWFYILNENFGALNWFAILLGSPERIRFLTGDPHALLSLVLADAWQWIPFVMLVMYAALQSIPEYVYEAAKMDGLTGWQTFWRVTLPNIKWGLLYGVILCNARAMGEFGAVSVVSGHIRGQTNTLPLHIEILYNEYNFTAAFAAASLFAMLALLTLVFKSIIEFKYRAELKAAAKMENNA